MPYRFRRFLNPPGLRTTRQHVIEADGVIVDWTYRQVDPGTAWPLVMDTGEYEGLGFRPAPEPICPSCGTTAQPHDTSPGPEEDLWKVAFRKLPREERRKIERMMATPAGRARIEAILAAKFTQNVQG